MNKDWLRIRVCLYPHIVIDTMFKYVRSTIRIEVLIEAILAKRAESIVRRRPLEVTTQGSQRHCISMEKQVYGPARYPRHTRFVLIDDGILARMSLREELA